MQLKNDRESKMRLDQSIMSFYRNQLDREVRIFRHLDDDDGNGYRVHFLVDRKHVVRYSIGKDREIWLGIVELGLGPHYFRPSYFWTYEDAERFEMIATTEAVAKNLTLLDEYLKTTD